MKKFFFFLIIFFLLVDKASAFSVSPLKHILTMDPGASQIVLVTIKNDDNISHKYKLGAESIKQDEQGNSVLARGADKAESWVFFSSREIEVAAKGSALIEFKINVPGNASPGAHFLGLTVAESTLKDKEIGVGKRLAVILQLQVAGLVKENAVIAKWMADNWVRNQELDLELAIKNNSNIEIPVSGIFVIKNFSGEEIYRDVMVLGGAIIPNTIREVDLKLAIDNLRVPGIYNVGGEIKYGLTGQLLQINSKFWYLPVWSWWLVGATLCLAGFSFWKLKNKLWGKF